MDRTCSSMRINRDEYRVSMGKPEGKRPLKRLRCSWVNNNKTELSEIV
jgi:hypothetical protein